MRVIVKKHDFLKTLSKVCRVADENLLVKASPDKTFAVAVSDAACGSPTVWIKSVFHAEVSARSKSGRDGEKAVAFVVNAKKTLEMVKNMDVEDIEMTKKNGRMVIKGARVRFDLISHDSCPVDYLLKNCEDVVNFRQVPASALLRLIERSLYTVTGKGYGVIETGLLLDMEGTRIRMVGTDGHRLAMAELEEDALSDLPPEGVILPYEGVRVFRSLLENCEEDEKVDFGFSESKVVVTFKNGVTTLSMRLVEGTYPDYRKVIPGNNDRVMRFGPGVLDSLKRVAIISNVVTIEATSEKVTFSSADGTTIGWGNNAGLHGDVEEVVDAEYESSHDGTKIHFNVRYLIDALNAMEDNRAVMLVKDEASAVVVRPMGKEPCEHQCIIMPVHI